MELIKALLLFTPLSSVFSCKGEAYHRRISEERVAGGSLLAYLDRDVSLDFIWQIAALAEANGNEKRFRWLMRRAFVRASQLEQDLATSPQHLFSLVDFYCRILDFSAARRVVETAKQFATVAADKLEVQIQALEVECTLSLPLFEEATRGFYARVAGEPELRGDKRVLDIYLPANAFRLQTIGYDGFQHDIRQAFHMLIADLDARGCTYSLRLRLATHGKIGEAARPFIAYHSVSDKANGLHIKESDRRSFFSADRRGYSGWSEFAAYNGPYAVGASPTVIKTFIDAERAAMINGNISKYDQPQKRAVGYARPYVFVALQVMDDAVQRLSHMHIFDMLEDICKHCRALGLQVVVKRHPKCVAPAMTIALHRGLKLQKFIISEASIHDLVSGSIAVCTINSSVGAEALLHGKPVYCFGAAEYQQACFQVKKRGSFATLFKLGELPRPKHEIEAILFDLRHTYSVNVREEQLAKCFFTEKLSRALKLTDDDLTLRISSRKD